MNKYKHWKKVVLNNSIKCLSCDASFEKDERVMLMQDSKNNPGHSWVKKSDGTTHLIKLNE